MDNLSGNSIKGYELRERIGAGGFGAVYKAYQSTVGREVAMKIILPHFASHPDFIRRFESEAQLVARLEHPYIVPLYDYWRDPDGAYLVMRWLRGGSLHEALKSGPFDLEAASLLLDQVTAGLAVAHRNSVIHRDLKPGNILLDEDGNAYLADFGIAKDVSAAKGITEVDAVVGSPDYLAPEQARSEQVTPCTDIYSLGVVLYEILTGRHPFADVSLVERLYKHLNEPLPFITSLADEVAGEVNEVIQKATTKNPAQRFNDVLEMAAAFRAAVRRPTGENVVESLTQREQEILQRIVEGKSNKEIAQELFLSIITVKWYITQIYRKLRVRSRMQAIVRARDLNLLGSGAGAPIAIEAVPTEDYHPENPYKGLRAFQLADSADFFGREKMVQKLVGRLSTEVGATHASPLQADHLERFLAVVGPSGSGKSSLVKAGLIPALLRGDLPGSERWFIVEMLPGAHPLDELEVALSRVAANQSTSLHEHLARDERGLLRASGLILPNDGSELVLVVDQFEEVFTLVEDEKTRQHFLNLILTAVTETRSRVRVVVTLRADFYDRPLQYPDFGELVRSRMETILPLTAEGLERAIAKPAERAGARFEEGVVAKIVGEVNYQPGALPLLQYALTELFERRQGRLLTHEAYLAVGGTIGALAKRADELYENLSQSGQEAARQMFLRLVTLGEGTEDTRRRVARSELLALATPHPPAPSPSGRRGENLESLQVPLHEGEGFRVRVEDDMDELIDTYASYRLLSLDNDPGTRAPTVEVAHEAILREWERLRAWLNDSRDDIKLQRQLSLATEDWLASKGDASFLVTGSRLEMFEKWAIETQLALTPLERDFLNACLEARTRQAAAEQARQAREQRLERRSQTFLRGLVAVLLLATLGAFGLTGVAVNQSQLANRNAAESQNLALVAASQAALAKGDTDQAIALAWQAVDLDPNSGKAQTALSEAAYAPGTIRRFIGHTKLVNSLALSPDGRYVLSASEDNTMILWEVETGSIMRRFEGHTKGVTGVVFSPDGDKVISSSNDGTLILWDFQTGEIIRRFEGSTGRVSKVALSPDGRTALSVGDEITPILWDVATGQIVRRFGTNEGHTLPIRTVAFSPDGHTALTGSEDTTLILWDVETGELVRRFGGNGEGHSFSISAVAISPDGRLVLSGANENTSILWDVETGKEIRRFSGGEGQVFGVAFSHDGHTVLTGGLAGSVSLWNVNTGERILRLQGHEAPVTTVVFAPNNRTALSGSGDGTLRLWNLEEGQVIRRFAGHTKWVSRIARSPDNRFVISSADDGTAILWDVQTGQEVFRYTASPSVGWVDYSPDGHSALISIAYPQGEQGDLILWDTGTGSEVRRFGPLPSRVESAAFSPDGRMVVSGGAARYIILWDVETGKEIRRFTGYENNDFFAAAGVFAVDFSPDGRTIFTGFGSGDIVLWDVANGKEIQALPGYQYTFSGNSFSFHEHRTLIGSVDGAAIVWDTESRTILHQFTDHRLTITQATLSPDGRLAIGGSGDNTTTLWDLQTGEVIRRWSGANDGSVSLAFSPDGRDAVVGFSDGRVELWRIDATLDELLTWTLANRYIPKLTCQQRELYRLEPLCDADDQLAISASS